MVVFTKIAALKIYLKNQGLQKSIGFVPTMGALHAGHIHLIEKALQENDLVICSIFINPIQFNNPNDFMGYPKTPEEDIEKLSRAGCHILFLPDTTEMYEANKDVPEIQLGPLAFVMEGKARPGHFKGVCTIVYKFFKIVEAHNAYFGEKDFQQLAVVKELVRFCNLPIKIIPCEIIREVDGLAMSSRNVRLSQTEREAAPMLYQALQLALTMSGTSAILEIKKTVQELLAQNTLICLDYFEIVNAETLQNLEDWKKDAAIRGCIAATIGSTRLIDNVAIIL